LLPDKSPCGNKNRVSQEISVGCNCALKTGWLIDMAWPVVEDGLRLGVHKVVTAGKDYSTPFRWQWTCDGIVTSWISVTVRCHSTTTGLLTLQYTCNGKSFDHSFQLQAEACRFGGYRWFAICPRTGRKASKLYALGGAGFNARKAYQRVAYRTQRASKSADMTLLRRDRILTGKLKGIDPEFVPKPKWMRWKTYHRWKAQLDQAARACNNHLQHLIARAEAL
jgi:hypothetical protein